MSLQKAQYVKNIYKALRQEPLEINDIDEFYQDTYPARGGNARLVLTNLLNNSIGDNKQILFVANGGCGKSTELVHLEKDINKDFLVFKYSALKDLDPMAINYIELIIITMQRLFEYIQEKQMEIPQDLLKEITDFVKIQEIQEVNNQYMSMASDVGVDGNLGIPLLAKFFAKFSLSAKSSRSMKNVLTQKVEPHFSTLVSNCNLLLKEVKTQIKSQGKKDLLIIIEDLDKIKLDVAEDLFLNYAQQITSLSSNVIFTYPISLYYHIRFNQIRPLFPDILELPMIKVTSKEGKEEEKGYHTMENIIKARMDLNLFADNSILKDFIRLSGGVIRDLFAMILSASDSCLIDGREIISHKDKDSAINKLKNEYRNTIADNDQAKIKASEYYEALVSLVNSTTKIPPNETRIMHLRQNLTILNYNGTNWSDVHPIVKENIKDMATN